MPTIKNNRNQLKTIEINVNLTNCIRKMKDFNI